MESAAHKLSEKIALHLHYDEDKKAVIEYGLIACFSLVVIGVAISVIGILLSLWYESIIIFFGVGILKKSTGGAHSRTMLGCFVISVFSISILALLSRYVLGMPINEYLNVGISLIIFLISLMVFYKRVPVDSPNKPIVKPQKIKRLRKQSFVLLVIVTALSIAFALLAHENARLYSVTFSFRFILVWQTFMLTKYGIGFVEILDSKFVVKEG